MKKRFGLAVRLASVLVLASLFAFGGLLSIRAAEAAGEGRGRPLSIVVIGYGWYYAIPEGQTNNAEDVALALDGEMILARDEHKRVIGRGRVHGFSVPVKWDLVFPTIIEKVEQYDADIILGLGTGGALRMEKYGGNVMSGRDAVDPATDIRYCGFTKIDPAGPDIREGTLPFEKMVLACLKAGIPAQLGYVRDYSPCPTDCTPYEDLVPPCIDDCESCSTVFPDGRPSTSPGWYMCNYMTYGIPMLIEKYGWNAIGGFCHVKTRPQYRAMDRLTDYEDAPPEDKIAVLQRSISSSDWLPMTIEGIRIALQECVRAKVGY